jgi:two-component system, chemotaxis family, response regulator Rcp1
MSTFPYHIVIADDDEDISDAIKEFSTQHVRISTVGNGLELLNYLLKKDAYSHNIDKLPDLVLLDINMPVKDGLVTLSEIKSNPALKHIPVHIITTMRSMEKLEECLDKGASNFFTKPNNRKGYVSMIENILTTTV